MSCVIPVWGKPTPKTPEDADRILGELLDRPSGKTLPKIAALREALWQHYPRGPSKSQNLGLMRQNTVSARPVMCYLY